MNGDVVYFYGHTRGPYACFSQFFACAFADGDGAYTCAEQFMMAGKAQLFGDRATLARIRAAQCPAQIKAFGRAVTPYDDARWAAARFGVVRRGNLLKFSQNEALRATLLATRTATLVEAAPNDRIWGIGISVKDALGGRAWNGENLLGKALMEVRDELAGTHAVAQPQPPADVGAVEAITTLVPKPKRAGSAGRAASWKQPRGDAPRQQRRDAHTGRYAPNDARDLLARARALLSRDDDEFRVVDFGAASGNVLDIAHEMWGDRAVCIGVEGGSRVNASAESAEFVGAANNKKHIHGMREEVLFEEVREHKHEIVTLKAALPTIGHVYDGGIMPCEVVACVIGIAHTLAPGSVMVFVTASDDTVGPRRCADASYIRENMLRNSAWIEETPCASVREYDAATGDAAAEATMQAIVFARHAVA